MTAASVLVVGAGLAGLRAVEGLRRGGFTGPVRVLGEEPHPPYNRPPLSKTLLAPDADASAVAFPLRSVGDTTWLLGAAARSAHLDARRVVDDRGREHPYDGLVVATGLRARGLPLPLPPERTHTLRTVEDARRLGARLAPGRRVLVLGCGPVGCEVAGRAVDLGAQVTVVAPDREPMERSVGPVLGRVLRRVHEQRGVRFHLRTVVRHVEPVRPDGAVAVGLEDGARLVADEVLVAVGSLPNTAWLEGNGLDLRDGVGCDHLLRAGGRPDVVACGDVAAFPLPPHGTTGRYEHWTTAAATGRFAGGVLAAALLGGDAAHPGPAGFAELPAFWSDQAGLRVQGYGVPEAGSRPEPVRGGADLPGVWAWPGSDGRWTALTIIGPQPYVAAQHDLVTALRREHAAVVR